MNMKYLLLLCCFAITAAAQSPKSTVVMAWAEVSETPAPSITLNWTVDTGQRKVEIYRKAKDATSWPRNPLTTLDSVQTTWTDTDVAVGTTYEYRLLREIIEVASIDTVTKLPIYRRFVSSGYVLSGIKAFPSDRGRVLVLVDTTMVSPLKAHLDTLRADLEAEAWLVDIRAVERVEGFDGAAVQRVRDLIRSVVVDNKRDLKAIFLVGRVPIPYSGDIAPDGHVPDHRGAWPADGIYGDDNGMYSDASVNINNTSRPVNANVVGDGKYDQSMFATPLETPVGRIDFYDMPAFTATELELLKAYFIKNHAFRTNKIDVINAGVIDDNFGGYGEHFAASAWRSQPPIIRDTAVKAGDWFGVLAGPRTYRFAYGCGGGTNTSAGGVGTSADLASKPVYAVHTQLFGSYFGDWNTKDNFLRASLASSPYALTCGWAGRPAWYVHHMGLGETIGYSFLLTANNLAIVGGQLGRYSPWVSYNAQGQGAIATVGDRGVHIALMGDPTLRASMTPVSAMSKVTATTEFPNKVNLSWSKPANDIDAYVVYRYVNANTGWERITPTAITATNFQDSLSNEGDVLYRVHGCALRSSYSGTYYEIGKGAVASVRTTTVAENGGADNSSANNSNNRSRASINGLATIVALAPNPAVGAVSATISVDHAGPLTISLTDLTGRVIWSEDLGEVNAGSFTVHIPQTAQMASGRYLVVVAGAHGTTAELLTIQR